MEVLGSKKYAPWLYVYAAFTNEFREGWVPKNYYSQVILPELNGKYGELANRKLLTNIMLDTELFPDLLYITNGLFLNSDQQIITKKEAVDYLTNLHHKIVYKTEDSLGGKGVTVIDPKHYNFNEITLLKNGVFQKFIEQHQIFNEMQPNSVATLRMTTAVVDGEVSLRASFLRIGHSEDKIVKTESCIWVPIDIETGELSYYGYTDEWLPLTEHPDTKYCFKDKKIPLYDKCRNKVIELHTKIPFIRIIGWDLIIDNTNNIQIMELNGNHPDITFSEATQGPIFKDLDF